MVSKVSFLSSWPIRTSRFWYNQLSNRSNYFSPERWKVEFSPPTKILSLSWTSSDILRDNCLVLWSWNMNFLTQWSVLSKMTSPIMQSVPNAILWVLNKNNVHKSESILQNPNLFWWNCWTWCYLTLWMCTMYQLAYAKEIKILELGLREERTQIDTGI